MVIPIRMHSDILEVLSYFIIFFLLKLNIMYYIALI